MRTSEGEGVLQPKRLPSRAAAPGTSPAAASQGFGGGEPLSEGVRRFFEPRFGCDFSQVRVHTDARASDAAQQLNARAFTTGSDIFLKQGEFKPTQRDGKELLAHELTHVVQQAGFASRIVKSPKVTPRIQRRLVTFGTLADVNALLGLLAPPGGPYARPEPGEQPGTDQRGPGGSPALGHASRQAHGDHQPRQAARRGDRRSWSATGLRRRVPGAE